MDPVEIQRMEDSVMNKKLKGLPKAITTITPQRISFFGGGTDLPAYYKEHGGGVISTAINQYVYVTVKRHSPLFQEEYRLSYSKTEHTDKLDDIENSIARECLRLIGLESPIYMSTAADLPAASGLGSSSSFAVGLLHALHLLKGERVSPAQLAEEACEVEINILRNPIGKQDQYAAAFGGLNHIKFRKNGRVDIDHIVAQNQLIDTLFENSLLIWTGIQRNASTVLAEQSKNIKNQTLGYNSLLADLEECKKMLLQHNSNFLNLFGGLLDKSWETKKNLESSVSSNVIDSMHGELKKLGSLGGKLCGAGGGGFLFEIVPVESQNKIIELYGNKRIVKVSAEPLGSRLLSEV